MFLKIVTLTEGVSASLYLEVYNSIYDSQASIRNCTSLAFFCTN